MQSQQTEAKQIVLFLKNAIMIRPKYQLITYRFSKALTTFYFTTISKGICGNATNSSKDKVYSFYNGQE